jgi:hypothetical protein
MTQDTYINIIGKLFKEIPQEKSTEAIEYVNKRIDDSKPNEHFYESLKELKNKPLLNKLTYNQLRQLWFCEHISDKEIANLFNTTLYQVKKQRNKLGITTNNMCAKEIISYLEEYIRNRNKSIEVHT